MERRVLLAVLLSFLVLYGYQAMFPSPPPAKPGQSSKAATAPKEAAPAPANPTPSIQPAAPLPAESGVPPTPVRDVVIDNADVHGVFTSRGAVIRSWKLKKYHDDQKRPYEMVAGHAPSDAPLPLTLATDDSAISALLASAPFTVAESTTADGSWQATFDTGSTAP